MNGISSGGSLVGVVAAGEVGGEVGGRRLRGSAAPHAERIEHVPLDIPLVGLAAHPRQDVPGQRRAEVGVAGDLARRPDPLRHVLGEDVAEFGHVLGLHAGALELHAANDSRLRHSAALVRSTAREALRDVLGVLRADPDADPVPERFDDVAALVRASSDARQPVVLHDRASPLPPATARVVYRTVQAEVGTA